MHFSSSFFYNDTAPSEIYTLSLHDALPICQPFVVENRPGASANTGTDAVAKSDPDGYTIGIRLDRKSTRLNSSHTVISYAVFCLKKKKKNHSILSSPNSHRHTGCYY